MGEEVDALSPALLALILAAAPAPASADLIPAADQAAKPEPPDAPGGDLPSQLLGSMSLREKVGQMIMSYPPLRPDSPVAVGSVIFLGNLVRSADGIRRRAESLQQRAKVPLLTAVDMEGGKLNRLRFVKELRQVPSARELGTMGEDEAGRWGRVVGKAMAGLGLNTNLGPVLDLADRGLMAASGRSIGGDPDLAARIGKAYAQGLRSQGVVAIGKHFPGYGEATKNSDHFLLVADRSEEELARGLSPFFALGDALGGVMLANLGYRAKGGMPAILCPPLVALAHERDWVAMTDDLAIRVLSEATGGDQEEVVRRAFLAGNDILLTTEPIDWKHALDVQGVVMDLVRARPELEARVNASALRVLRLKDRAGLLEPLRAKARTALGEPLGRGHKR